MEAKKEPVSENEYDVRKIADLKPHPFQAEVFTDLPDAQIGWLAESIDKNGLENPVEILPDDTLIAGHQRLRAIRLLGREEIDVCIRHDLAAAGEDAIREYLIRDNLDRRQMDLLSIARCYKQLKQIAAKCPDRLSPREKGDLRDELAKQFGVSGRTLDRYVRVLDLPRPIQDAVSAGNLALIVAGKIANLTPKKQKQIAERISGGEQPKQVTKEFLSQKGDHRSGKSPVASFGRSLQRSANDVSSQIDRIKEGDECLIEFLPVFRQTSMMLDLIVERLEQK